MYCDPGKVCYTKKINTYSLLKKTLQLKINDMFMNIHDFIRNISEIFLCLKNSNIPFIKNEDIRYVSNTIKLMA